MTIQEVDIAQRLNIPVMYERHEDATYKIIEIRKWYEISITKSFRYSATLQNIEIPKHLIQVSIFNLIPTEDGKEMLEQHLKNSRPPKLNAQIKTAFAVQKLNVPVILNENTYRIAQIIRRTSGTKRKRMHYSVLLEINGRLAHINEIDVSEIKPVHGFEPVIERYLSGRTERKESA